MKKLLKWIIIIVLCVIAYKAYNASQKNGKSFLQNAGKECKELFQKGKVKAKDASQEFQKGFETDSVE